MDKRLKDIEDKTTAFKEMQAKVKKEMESVQESNSVINGGGESSNNNDQVPKVADFLGVRKAEEDSLSSNLVALTTHLFTVGVQTSQMQMMPTSIQMFLWESFDEDPSSMDDSSTITASGLLEQINVTRDTSDYLWYTTRKGFRYGHDTIVDGMIKDGL
ncbi:uncharacterized protein LOC107477839 [Arachis duranensis]|uniref:Uncharacterized protein LOC107477839 n=1 Tax=Arachis duranensis TaxID=130453 RepID=A0A9C6WMW6_ARADU|nr:uncharacterized protein LOC107477839 [Arachis duranensis]XP_052115487.1 uncharacterized protein LOC107477839 [Arachis duranensis]